MGDNSLTLFRVWKTDGRYRLVAAANERQALRQVRHSVKAEPAPARTIGAVA